MEEINFKDNPAYQIAYQTDKHIFYVPTEITAYHKSRELAMQAQERYANAGITKDNLQAIAQKALEIVNKENSVTTIKSDMAVLWNNILARTKDPVDELCAVRMGAIACFVERENPAEVNNFWTQHKMKVAESDPDVYAFFLTLGIELIPEYKTALRSLNMQDYFSRREETIKGLTLQPIPRNG